VAIESRQLIADRCLVLGTDLVVQLLEQRPHATHDLDPPVAVLTNLIDGKSEVVLPVRRNHHTSARTAILLPGLADNSVVPTRRRVSPR